MKKFIVIAILLAASMVYGAGQLNYVNGIVFPATQVPSSGANTLDDFEEGTWTPTMTYSVDAGDMAYITQLGTYTKIGKSVFVNGVVRVNETTANGYIRIASLPFVIANTAGLSVTGTIWPYGYAALTSIYVDGVPNTTYLEVFDIAGNRITNVNTTADCQLTFSLFYQTTN